MTVDQAIKDAANAAAEDALLQGIENTKRETALRMLRHGGLSDEFICEMADITPEELSGLKNYLPFKD